MDIYIARIFREGWECCETVPIKASSESNAQLLAYMYNDFAVHTGETPKMIDLSIWTMEMWLEKAAIDEDEEDMGGESEDESSKIIIAKK